MVKQEPLDPDETYTNLHRRIPGEPEPAFEHPLMQEKVWRRVWGLDNDVGRLRMVLVSRPGDEWKPMMSGGTYDEDCEAWIGPKNMWYWGDRERPDLAKAQAQHDTLVDTLRSEGAEVVSLENPLPHMTKSVFTRDQAIIVKAGAIICRMGVSYRRGEELPITRTLARLGMPILHTIHGTGLMEGGSFAWLTPRTAVVAVGHRSNEEGARQLAEVLRPMGVELLQVPNRGFGLHIDGSMVMVDEDLVLAFPRGLPYWFNARLQELGIRMVDADPLEGAFAVNCLAVRPGKIIISAHAERTIRRLRQAGVEVVPMDYSEMPKSGGGIHCSTLPLIRDAVE